MDNKLRRDACILRYASKIKQKGIKEAWKDDKGYWVTVNDGYEASRSNDKTTIFAKNINDLSKQMYGIRLIDEPLPTNIIHNIRTAIGMTQVEFSEYLSIPLRNIENWEGDKSAPPDYLVKLIGYKVRNSLVPYAIGDTVPLTLENYVCAFGEKPMRGEKMITKHKGKLVLCDIQNGSDDGILCSSGDAVELAGIDERKGVVSVVGKNDFFFLTFEEFNIMANDSFVRAERITELDDGKENTK